MPRICAKTVRLSCFLYICWDWCELPAKVVGTFRKKTCRYTTKWKETCIFANECYLLSMKHFFKQLILCVFALFPLAGNVIAGNGDERECPTWAKDLVIYEVAPKSFNSPEGPEQGTFRSVQEKLPYLKKLGINAIWLAGYTWSDPHHFYNIWTQYACVRQDSLDVSLGTRKDFQKLIRAAHKQGIRVFLDVITHGVMSDSPLIEEHPDWFKGGSWGMTDFDWDGGHKDLDDWWVKTFTDYVVKDGVDGFRLDVAIYRTDLWKRIQQNAREQGHAIVVIQENPFSYTDNVADLYQSCHHLIDIRHSRTQPVISDGDYVWNVGRYCSQGMVDEYNRWNQNRPEGMSEADFLLSFETSSHDNGWDTFPSGENPYLLRGRRSFMGYSALLAPTIPILMSGDEFNADYVPIPYLAGSLFGDKRPNEGYWCYGSWIQWNQLQDPDKASMWQDTKRLLDIRRRYAHLIHAWRISTPEGILELSNMNPSAEKLPVPYVLYDGKEALLVAANPTNQDVEIKVQVPYQKLGFAQAKEVKVKDLWSRKPIRTKLHDDGTFVFRVPKDQAPRGGLAVWLLY